MLYSNFEELENGLIEMYQKSFQCLKAIMETIEQVAEEVSDGSEKEPDALIKGLEDSIQYKTGFNFGYQMGLNDAAGSLYLACFGGRKMTELWTLTMGDGHGFNIEEFMKGGDPDGSK